MKNSAGGNLSSSLRAKRSNLVFRSAIRLLHCVRNDEPARRTGRTPLLRCALLSFALIFLSSTSFAVDPLPFENREEEVRFQKLAAELRCLQCQNQNLADSDSALAKDLRQLVFEQMQSGKSDSDIKVFLIQRYGDFVIYDPPVNAQTAPLWIAPFLGFAVLIGALIYRARRGKTVSANSDNPGDNPNHKPHQEDW